MKLATYETPAGPRLGVVEGEDLFELEGLELPDVGALLRGPGLAAAQRGARVGPWASAKLLPPVLEPRRIVCVGANYALHREEMGRGDLPYPTLFVRWPSSLVGHGRDIVRPKASERFDFEGELAFVVGREARNVDEADALTYVAGYACFDDGSVRDFQRHTTQFTPGKNFDASGAFGPYMVTADDVGDPHALELATRVNGETLQSANTEQMTFRIPHLLAYISSFTTLEPGDVVATGTPSGVGDKRTPPVYLRDGDRLEVEITRVGRLCVGVRDE